MTFDSLTFAWYQNLTSSELEQGDFLDDFPIIIPQLNPSIHIDELGTAEIEIPVEVELYDVIVMTQSCDFQKMEDEDPVTLCPRFKYSDWYGKDMWKLLQRGQMTGVHLLNRCTLSGHEFEYQIVDFSKIFNVPLRLVKEFVLEKERIRLLPPYREHLAQAFARRFMRVGLPIDVPQKYPYPLST